MDDQFKDNRKKEKKIRGVKVEKERKEKSKGLKLKIKLRPPISNSDSPEKWTSEVIASQDITPTEESTKKRTTDEIHQNNDSMQKKIKIESNMDGPYFTAKLATSEEVDELIKNEVDEILGLEKSFREKLDEDLMKLIDWDTDDGNEVLDIKVPPKTPQKYLENTIEKLKNRIGNAPRNIFEADDDAEGKVLELLLQELPDESNSASSVARSENLLKESSSLVHNSKSLQHSQEMLTPGAANLEGDINLGYVVGDIKTTEDVNIITLHPTEASE